jgi:hypothetical protein
MNMNLIIIRLIWLVEKVPIYWDILDCNTICHFCQLIVKYNTVLRSKPEREDRGYLISEIGFRFSRWMQISASPQVHDEGNVMSRRLRLSRGLSSIQWHGKLSMFIKKFCDLHNKTDKNSFFSTTTCTLQYTFDQRE